MRILRHALGTIACAALASVDSLASAPARVAPHTSWVARPDKLQPWTTRLRDKQSDDPFALVYRAGPRRLVFVGAVHANQAGSLTFRIIRDAFATFHFDTVIAEGFPTARGPNPTSIFKYVAENGPDKNGFVEAGELVPTALGAKTEPATLWGGEAQDQDVKMRVLSQGFSREDVLGFYVLRNIPQWIRERHLKHAADPALKPLVIAALVRNREKLQLQPDVLPSFDDWAAWYKALNGKPIDATFATEEVGPLADGRFGTNKIGYAISRVRDAFLHELIVAHLNSNESVLVVFGGSHLMIHEPALNAVLGAPCYTGADLRQAGAVCR